MAGMGGNGVWESDGRDGRGWGVRVWESDGGMSREMRGDKV